VLGALAMVAVALVSAFITMRFAIHGREAVVPAITGLSIADASHAAGHVGLNLTLENRFYSAAVPAGRILAQDPAPGSRVRREWAIRVTESLGPQQVSVPDLIGESERAATVSIRRLSLEPGVVAHLAVPGDTDVVLAQTPQPNDGAADSPRVSLLVSDPGSVEPPAYVMPSLVGLTFAAAAERAAAAGLHLELAQNAPPAAATPAASAASPNAVPSAAPKPPPAVPPATSNALPSVVPTPLPVIRAAGIVTAQTPQAGRRILQGDAVHIALAEPSATQPSPAPISPTLPAKN
jgi:eukaryotic-like serine/threonine-protein kinase